MVKGVRYRQSPSKSAVGLAERANCLVIGLSASLSALARPSGKAASPKTVTAPWSLTPRFCVAMAVLPVESESN